MKHYLTLFLFLFIIACYDGFAKKDYRNGFIINTENDTVFGQIAYRNSSKNYKSCMFKVDDIVKEYSANQISGFGITDDYLFTSQILSDSFVEVLVEGFLNLYMSDQFFILKKDTNEIVKFKRYTNSDISVGSGFEIKSNEWRGTLTNLMSDYIPDADELVNKTNFNEIDLSEIVIKYNRCRTGYFKVYKSKKTLAETHFGVALGLNVKTLRILNFSDDFPFLPESYKSTDPSIGFIATFNSPRVLENFYLQPEIHISKSSYSALTTYEDLKQWICESYIDLTTISIPYSIKYRITGKKNKLFAQLGIVHDINVGKKTKLFKESLSKNVVFTYPQENAFNIGRIQSGFWGGIEFLREFKSFNISTNLRYYGVTKLNETGTFNAVPNIYAFSIIVYTK